MWTPEQWYNEAREQAEANPGQIRGMAEMWLGTLMNGMPGVPREEVVRRLMEENQRRLEAVPSLKEYPELRGMRELVEASWRGTRDGAQLDDALLASHAGSFFYYQRYVTSGKAATGCSYVYFPRSDHGPILANNLDTTPEEPFTSPHWPLLSEHLILGTVSSGVFLDEESPEIFPAPVFRLVSRYCRTTDEAIEMLKRYNYFWGPCNAILIDRNNDVAMFEKTACRIAVRKSPDGFGHITAMAQEDSELRDYVQDRQKASLDARGLCEDCDDTHYWKAQYRRSALMGDLVDEARQNPTLDKLREIIQYRNPERGNVAGNGEPVRPHATDSGIFEHTTKTQIWLLGKGQAQWWARDNNTGTPSWENRQVDVNFENVLLWE